jgi:hypothetical protein
MREFHRCANFAEGVMAPPEVHLVSRRGQDSPPGTAPPDRAVDHTARALNSTMKEHCKRDTTHRPREFDRMTTRASARFFGKRSANTVNRVLVPG